METAANAPGSHRGKVNEPLPAPIFALRDAKMRSHDAEKPCRNGVRTIESL